MSINITQPKNKQKLTEVRVPFIVNNIKSINIKEIQQKLKLNNRYISLKQESLGKIYLQKRNPQTRQALNFKIFKHKKTGEIKAMVQNLGNIETQYDFQSFMDFYTPPVLKDEILIQQLEGKLKKTEKFKNIKQEDYLNTIVPTWYTKKQIKLKPMHIDLSESKPKKILKNRVNQGQKAEWINFEEGVVPLPNKNENAVFAILPQNQQQLAILIQKYFEIRPIWLKNTLLRKLQENLEINTEYSVRKILSHISYTFRDGPWKNTYIRKGYDPRKDQNASIFQVFDVGQNKGASILASTPYHKPQGIDTYDPTFSVKPVRQRQLYQLIDISDIKIQKICDDIDLYLNEHCLKSNGWIKVSKIRSIQAIMKNKFLK